MCGIAGILLHGPDPPSSSRPSEAGRLGAAARAMAATLRHRGPDGLAAWASPGGGCALGHARLKVIDPETGDQPMGNEDGSVWVVFNGEIYNFPELRSRLEAAGHRFRTRSDTEVLVHGWEEWWEDLPVHLDGMFAFGVWDERRRSLFLARDRAGKKPLFIYEGEGRLAFGSELKAILALEGVDDTLDPRAVPMYLAYGYVPTPGTFYHRIRKLPPGSWLSVGPGKPPRQARYWELDPAPEPRSPARASRELRDLLTAAVEKRLVSDVPLGAFLSGGIDSTIVVGLMSGLLREPVRTFSVGMAGDPGYDESYFARMAAQRFGTIHTAFDLTGQDLDFLEELLDAYDEPFGDSSALPTYLISRLTRGEVTVALTGDGGDEVFAGYPRFLGMVLADRVPAWMTRGGASVVGLLPLNPDFRSLPRRARRFFAAASLPGHERMLRWIGYFPDPSGSLLRPELGKLLSREDLTRSFSDPLSRLQGRSTLARTLALNFETYLLDDLLVKADRCSMSHGLELRSPFLDTAVVEFSFGLPDDLKIRRGRLKHILKAAFPDLVPQPIRRRKKMGFGIPLPGWFRTRWRPLLENRILSHDSPLWHWVRRGEVTRLVDEHSAGRADHGHQIWALLTLDGWLRRGRFSLPPGSPNPSTPPDR